MRLLKSAISTLFFVLISATPVLAFPPDNLSSTLSGKILLDVDKNGEAWYVYPGDFHRYFLGTPDDAYGLMENLSLGVSNADFVKIASSTSDKFKGMILLKVEDVGKAYYVNPADKSLVYMADGKGAFRVMREYSLGVTGADLENIPVAKIITDSSGKQISREWQNLGWWGKVNRNYVSVMAEPKSDSKRSGTLYFSNTVKVLDIEKADGRTWYKIDGGQFPGTFIDSRFISAVAQPVPEKISVVPSKVKDGDYWVDVNIARKVLTLFKGMEPVMATYVATGHPESPTISGTYNVYLKLAKTRMKGAPPLATHEYDLPNVPWVMYYKGSFSVHGTYWHDDFGAQRSAGCTNITQGDAKYIYDLTGPKMDGKDSVFSTIDNPGMVVNNHY